MLRRNSSERSYLIRQWFFPLFYLLFWFPKVKCSLTFDCFSKYSIFILWISWVFSCLFKLRNNYEVIFFPRLFSLLPFIKLLCFLSFPWPLSFLQQQNVAGLLLRQSHCKGRVCPWLNLSSFRTEQMMLLDQPLSICYH